MFLYIGGEGTASCPSGYVTELAKKFKALVVTLEHRFYGESIPNDSSATENLKYLTVNNALADLATFTDWFKADQNLTNSKVNPNPNRTRTRTRTLTLTIS